MISILSGLALALIIVLLLGIPFTLLIWGKISILQHLSCNLILLAVWILFVSFYFGRFGVKSEEISNFSYSHVYKLIENGDERVVSLIRESMSDGQITVGEYSAIFDLHKELSIDRELAERNELKAKILDSLSEK